MKDLVKGKLVQFQQPREFFVRRANAREKEGALLEASVMYRRAVEQEPYNQEVILKLAQIYSDMGCFELSNRTLFPLLWKCHDIPTQFFYLASCNFMALRDFNKAMVYFERFLSLSAKTEPHYTEVNEYLRAMSGLAKELEEDDSEARSYFLTEQASHLINKGDAQEAVDRLAAEIKTNPTCELCAMLATAYLALEKYDQADAACERAFMLDDEDIRANCVKALVCHRRGDLERMNQAVELVHDKMVDISIDELFLSGMMLAEIGMEFRASEYLESGLLDEPYRIPMIHACAALAARRGDDKQAYQHWSTILKLTGDDPVAAYYTGKIKSGCKNAEFIYRLPLEEEISRMRLISDALDGSAGYTCGDLQSALRWAMDYGPLDCRIGAVRLISQCMPDRAELLLKDYLSQPYCNEKLRTVILNALSAMSAKEPYVMVEDGGILEVRLGMPADIYLPDSYKQIGELMTQSLKARKEDRLLLNCLGILTTFVKAQGGKLRAIKSPANYAAAIEYIAGCSDDRFYKTQAQVCALYNVKVHSLSGALQLLDQVMGIYQ